jgi:hypothetical protein
MTLKNMQLKDGQSIKLCLDCFNCKTKEKFVYCKMGYWREKKKLKSILYTPYDFSCDNWDGEYD